MGFQKVAKIEELWSGEMISLEMNGQHVLLINVDNRIYAYADASLGIRCLQRIWSKPSECVSENVSDQGRR